jgi:hypothetical protein
MQNKKNYSFLDKSLHYIVLSSNFLKLHLFKLNEFLFLKDAIKIKIEENICVMGLARAGTTVLTNKIYCSYKFASLTYDDMPFVIAPNLWGNITKINRKEIKFQERSHKDRIFLSNFSPESFEEVFWSLFTPNYTFDNFLKSHEISNSLIKKYVNYQKLICLKYEKTRYLSKNNNNILRIKSLVKKLPNFVFLIVFRDPKNHSLSLLNQHLKFSNSDKFTRAYMGWLIHYEFGIDHKFFNLSKKPSFKYSEKNNINYWLEIWIYVYEYVLQAVNLLNSKKTFFISYDRLCSNKNYFKKIEKKFNFISNDSVNFKSINVKNFPEFDSQLLSKAELLYQKLLNHKISLDLC